MSSFERPSPLTIREIYCALVEKPRSFEDLIARTGIDRTILKRSLDFLKDKGLIVSYNFANCVTFRMVRTQPLRYGWNFPWLELMLSNGDWKTPWKHVIYRINEKENEFKDRFRKVLNDLLVDSNLDLIEVLEELGMSDVPLEVFKFHNQEPYCLECLKKEERFVRMILCEKSEEHCCPNCGVVRETLLIKRR